MSFVPRRPEELELVWPEELDHFSASSAKMAVRCPEQWRQRYVHGRKAPPSLSMIGGRADHKAVETSMAQKVETFVDLPIGEVTSLFVSEVERNVDEAGGLSELEWKEGVTGAGRIRAFDELRTDGQDLLKRYHLQVSPHWQPTMVEKKFDLMVPGMPVKMIGYIDLVASDAQALEPSYRMIDRKRRSKNSLKLEAEWTIQAEVYQLALPLPFDFHISVTTSKPTILTGDPQLTLPVPPRARSERLLQQIVASIGFYYRKFGPDEPWPAQGRLHPWACGYCGYRDGCWAWATTP